MAFLRGIADLFHDPDPDAPFPDEEPAPIHPALIGAGLAFAMFAAAGLITS